MNLLNERSILLRASIELKNSTGISPEKLFLERPITSNEDKVERSFGKLPVKWLEERFKNRSLEHPLKNPSQISPENSLEERSRCSRAEQLTTAGTWPDT